MAPVVKTKIVLILFSIVTLVALSAMRRSLREATKIKPWGKITREDFQGVVPLFSRYAAAIATNVYLEYNPTDSTYVAYAGQVNTNSWYRSSNHDSPYLLAHEQYHFNITELHARKMNDYIRENPGASLYALNLRLESIRIDLDEMQDRYDSETDHSTIISKQRYWEYHIDSLLNLDQGWVTDKYSGAKIFFNAAPDSTKGLTDQLLPYRQYFMYRYGMLFTMSSYQSDEINYDTLGKSIPRTIRGRGDLLKSIVIDKTNSFQAEVMAVDTSKQIYHERWFVEEPYIYRLRALFVNNGDTSSYAKIASSFLNSFQIEDTDQFWIDYNNANEYSVVSHELEKYSKSTSSDESMCFKILNSSPTMFYRGPIYQESDTILIACDFVVDHDSTHFINGLLRPGEFRSSKPTGKMQVYSIPKSIKPLGSSELRFGYLLLKDSSDECYSFRNQLIQVQQQKSNL